jgi:hypothetical protein
MQTEKADIRPKLRAGSFHRREMRKTILVLAALIAGMVPQAASAQTVNANHMIWWYTGDNVPSASLVGLFAGNTPGGVTHCFIGDVEGQSNSTFTWDSTNNIAAMVSTCHTNGAKALVDIGPFGNLPACISNNVNLCVTNIVNIMNQFGFDGISYDWESGFNTSLSDSFVHALRAAVGPNKLIVNAAADIFTQAAYFGGPIMSYLDMIMGFGYDLGSCIAGTSWFSMALHNYASGAGSFGVGLFSWDALRTRMINAGTPVSKIIGAVEFAGRPWSGGSQVVSGPLRACSGSYHIDDLNYNSAVGSYGSLMASPNWDATVHENWITKPDGYFMDFENARSLADKVAYIKQNNMAGWIAFNVNMDYFPSQPTSATKHPLLAALVAASAPAGAPPNPPTGLTATVQ